MYNTEGKKKKNYVQATLTVAIPVKLSIWLALH